MSRQLTDAEFLALLAGPESKWDLDPQGQFLILPVSARDLAWALECCREHAEGDWYMHRRGGMFVFAREGDLAFVRLACL